MANYAELNSENKVLRVVVINDSWTEQMAQSFLKGISDNVWIKDDSSIHVSKGHEYHSIEGKQFFTFKKPFSSWILDKELKIYLPPIPRPLAIPVGYVVYWSEKLKSWVQRRIGNVDSRII